MRYDLLPFEGGFVTRFAIFLSCLALSFATGAVHAQTISVYQTTPDLLEALSERATLHFSANSDKAATEPIITVDDAQRFQEIDGFGASLTDSAAWLFAKKSHAGQDRRGVQTLFSRRTALRLSILRQPVGSSDLAVTFYSFDDLCEQTAKACTTPAGVADPKLDHFSLKHDQEYILPLLRKAIGLNPAMHVMLTPWSPPGWMKTSGSMLGSNPETKEKVEPAARVLPAFAGYLVKTIQGYQAAGVPVWALSVQNEPLFAPPTYSGMQMLAAEQAAFFGERAGPALAAAHLIRK
jgi:glucosylceramidase